MHHLLPASTNEGDSSPVALRGGVRRHLLSGDTHVLVAPCRARQPPTRQPATACRGRVPLEQSVPRMVWIPSAQWALSEGPPLERLGRSLNDLIASPESLACAHRASPVQIEGGDPIPATGQLVFTSPPHWRSRAGADTANAATVRREPAPHAVELPVAEAHREGVVHARGDLALDAYVEEFTKPVERPLRHRTPLMPRKRWLSKTDGASSASTGIAASARES